MTPRRVHTAVIRDGLVLMVRHVHDGRDYWTLPGGSVEAGETAEQAARREIEEETGIEPLELEMLFEDGHEICFLATCSADEVAVVGHDPELAGRRQIITEVRWFPLEDKRDDLQVSKILPHLR